MLNIQHIVLRLLHDRPDEAKPVCHPPRRHDLVRVPFRSSPVKRLTSVDKVIEGPHGLLHGCVAVGSVGVDNINIVELKSLEGLVHSFNDVLARQTGVVDRVLAKRATPVELFRSK